MCKATPLFCIIALIALSNCGGSRLDKYPMEKRYWDPDDYAKVLALIEFKTPKDEQYPNLADPETSPIFNKLIDKENLSVVLEDNSLGLKHRSDFGEDMFRKYQTMVQLYSGIDREDKYVYDMELVKIMDFGMYFQPLYFGLGNEAIIQEADDPKASGVVSVIRGNEQTLLSNFELYLDKVNNEKSFSEDALEFLAGAINTNFPRVIASLPDANYSSLKKKTEAMLNKTSSAAMKKALTDLNSLLESKVKPAPAIQ